MDPGDVVFGGGERGDRRGGLGAQGPGPLDGGRRVGELGGQAPLPGGGLSVHLGLLTLVGGFSAAGAGGLAVQALGGAGQQRAGPFDGFPGALLQGLRRLAERPAAFVEAAFPLVQLALALIRPFFALVGLPLALVGPVLPLIGQRLPLVGAAFPLVRRPFPLAGFAVAVEGRAVVFVLRVQAVAAWRISDSPSRGPRVPGGHVRAEFRDHGGHPHIAVTSLTGEVLAAYRVERRGQLYRLRAVRADRFPPPGPQDRSRALRESFEDWLVWSATLRDRVAAERARSREVCSNAAAAPGQAPVPRPGSNPLIARSVTLRAAAVAQTARAALLLQAAQTQQRVKAAAPPHGARPHPPSAAKALSARTAASSPPSWGNPHRSGPPALTVRHAGARRFAEG